MLKRSDMVKRFISRFWFQISMTKKVIYADDDILWQHAFPDAMRRFCNASKIDVSLEVVCDGKALVEKVLGEDYDLIFTDFQMPELDGIQAIVRIREHNQTTPLYMLSSSSAPEDMERALRAGATGFIPKSRYELGIEQAVNLHLR